MAGALNMLLADSGNSQTILVGVVGPANGMFGFLSGFQGSVSPGTVSGFTIDWLGNLSNGTEDFQLRLFAYTGTKGGLFTTVQAFNQANSPQNFSAASATYTAGTVSTDAIWHWGTGSNMIWTAGGINRNVTFF